MRSKTAERPLTAAEHHLLSWLVETGLPADSQYVRQVSFSRVVGRCDCGCPTVDLAVGEHPPSHEAPLEDIVNAIGHSPEGVQVGVILFARGGELCSLEVYSLAGEEGCSVPDPSALQLE